ncbi:MAG: hypothetical protein WCA31_13460 [Acidimicrobiales bacterium]
MDATIAWVALLVAGALVELMARLHPRRVSSLERTGARLATHVAGRALLWALWIFVGLHLFARYTMPHSFL